MQNPIQKFRQNSIVFEKPGILYEKVKALTSSNYTTVQYLLLKLRTHFVLTNVYKNMVSTHLFFTFLLITQDLSKIKKIPNFLLKTLLSIKRAQNFRKKHQTSWKLELRKKHQTSWKFSVFQTKTWFLRNNRPLP